MVAKNALLTTLGVEKQIGAIFASAFTGIPVGPGLIVGQRSSTSQCNDHAIYLARTPLPDDINIDNVSALELQKKLGGDNIDVDWMCEHAKQVTRMLPGGLQILGILLVDAIEIVNSSSQCVFKNKIEKLLESIETVNKKTSIAAADELNCEVSMYVMNVNKTAKTFNLQMVQIPVDSNGNVCKEIEMKWKQSYKVAASEDNITAGPWQVVKANFVLDYPVVFSPDQTEGLTLSGKVDIALESVKKSISTAIVLFDGMKRVHSSSGHYLDTSKKTSTASKKDGGKKSKGKSSKKHQNYDETDDESHIETGTQVKEYTADILLATYLTAEEDHQAPNEVTVDSGSRLRFCGKMCVRVYMRPNATIKEATNAIKEDILRSLSARLEMHCDSLVGEETKGTEKEDMPIVHEPPRRCLIGLPQRDDDGNDETSVEADSIMISDFLFPGETSYDSIESVQEVFGFPPAISRMDDDQELVAGIQHLNMNGSGELTAGNVTHTVKDELGMGKSGKLESPSRLAAEAAKRSNFNLIAFLLSVIIAIAGIWVSYLAMSTGTNVASEDEFVVPSRTNDHHPNIETE